MHHAFDFFDEHLRRALTLAQEEATRFGTPFIGCEHLLLGMLRCEGAGVLTILDELGVETAQLRSNMEMQIARDDAPQSGELGLMLRAKKAIELAVAEAQMRGHRAVATEHLLLGMLRQGEGPAFVALTAQGVTLEAVQAAVSRLHLMKWDVSGAGEEAIGGSGADSAPERSANERFDKFTERARKVLTLAQEEATRFNHPYIGTEHLLLGLVREGEGVAAKVLSNLGVGLNRVRSAVEFIIGRGDRPAVGEAGLTPRAKRVIELAVDEARRLGHHYIGTEHLLLGLVREGDGIASGVLESLGVTLEKVRTQTIQVLSQTVHGPAHGGASASAATEDTAHMGEPVPLPAQQRTGRARAVEYLVAHVRSNGGPPMVLRVDGRDDLALVPGQAPLHHLLALLGAEGWELVGIDRPEPVSGNGVAFYIFSRPGER